MRVLLALAVLLAAWLLPAPAQAACNSSNQCATYSEAWAACQARLPPLNYTQGNLRAVTVCKNATQIGPNYVGAFRTSTRISDGSLIGTDWPDYWSFSGGLNCPAGQEVAPEGGCQCTGGYKFDPYNPSQCMTDQKCRALNSTLGGAERTMSGESYCPAHGCQMRVQPGTATKRNGQGGALVSGLFEYTGESCGTSPTNPAPPPEKITPTPEPQECVTYQSGQKMCQKRDGQQCYTTTNGRQNCWRPGEVGEKTDGPVLQKRNAGPTEVPPENLQLPSGDSLQKNGESKTETTQQKNGTTSTTTTTNYTTTNGTNANGGKEGSKDSGESGTGDGSGKPGDGDDKGTASGGGDCKTPPVITGDQVLGMVATQAWHTRCAVEAGNAAKVTGDVADCKSQFTVEGDNANAVKLRAMRAQLCNGDKNGNNRPDWTEANGTESPEPGQGDEEPGVLAKLLNTDALDTGGFLGGSASCPAMGVVDLKFAQVDLSSASWWCPFVAMCRAILLLMGAFIALRLLME